MFHNRKQISIDHAQKSIIKHLGGENRNKFFFVLYYSNENENIVQTTTTNR